MLYDIAGLLVSCTGCGERFGRQAEAYVSAREGEPDICVAVKESELESALSRGILGEDDCRYMLSGMRFYFELLPLGGLMLHSSAVAVDGMAYLFSGPSGVGKGTVAKALLEGSGGNMVFSVSATTRAPRPGEEHGREYFFVTPD